MIITFIGNCQTVSLCFYFQQLLTCEVYWILFGNEFKPHLGEWSDKVKNKIIDPEKSINCIKNSDIIIYQQIIKDKSYFSNDETLQNLKKETCILIKIPSIYLDYSDYEYSIRELKKREIENEVNVKVSDIFEEYKNDKLMLTVNHPNTFLFLKIVDKLCNILGINTFTQNEKEIFLKKDNYMNLP